MAQKKVTTKTEEVIDTDLIQNDSLLTPMGLEENEPEQDELAEFLSTIGGGGDIAVKVFKLYNGQLSYCDTYDPAMISEAMIRDTWGGGRFALKAIRDNKYIKGGSKNFNIMEKPSGVRQETVQNPPNNQADLIAFQFQALQNQIASQQNLILEMIKNNASKGSNIAEIIQVATLLHSQNKVPDSSGILTSTMETLKTMMEIAKETVSPGGGESSWMDLAGKAIENFGPMVAGIMAQRGGPGIVQPQPAVMGESRGSGETVDHTARPLLNGGGGMAPDAQVLLRQAFADLKKRALKGFDVNLVVDWIAENIDEPQYKSVVLTVLNMPFEALGTFDAELLQEPYATWFKNLIEGLKEVLHADQNAETTTRTAGSGTDVTGNGKADS